MNELKGKLNGISLFSGYGGIDLALESHIRTILYCEIDEYQQANLISRMDDESLPFAPVWNDITTMDGAKLRGVVDIVFGGFPCQDISTAGKGAGLDGKRSGLFFEFVRVLHESGAPFAFFENVAAIEARGAEKVQEALADIGFTAKWLHLSASEVGANHKRERWFCLAANPDRLQLWLQPGGSSRKNRKNKTLSRVNGPKESVANSEGRNDGSSFTRESKRQIQQSGVGCFEKNVSNPYSSGLQEKGPELEATGALKHGALHPDWWSFEPEVGRVVNGSSLRMDTIEFRDGRIFHKKSGELQEETEVLKLFRTFEVKACGNGVVPLQALVAYETLMGIS